MILTVDIGNSRIKWASWEADRIVARGVAAYNEAATANMFDKLFSTLIEASSAKPSYVFALCVAGVVKQQALSTWVKQHWQLDVEFLTTEKHYKNIINGYADPSQHGVDRWAAVVAGFQGNPGASVCVISAGTAITFDLITQSGQHLGGYILPSYASMHKCLLSDTMNLESTLQELSPAVLPVQQQTVPDNTYDAVNQGLHKLLQAGIREICQYARNRLDGPVRILLTGGFAETILRYPDMPVMHHHPDLVMQGLYNIMMQR
jgi:type III pantothenate kinase